MRAFVLGSGSSGNAVLVEAAGTRVLVDCGLGPRSIAARLESLGAALLPRGVDAILPTHEHGDHFGGVERLARALGAPVLLHARIEGARVRKRFDVRDLEVGRTFRLGELDIHTEAMPHDAPQIAVRLATRERAFAIATDVGHVTPALVTLLSGCDAAIVESNHCAEMLATGTYPEHLKRRVAGGKGHLSNDQTAALLGKLVGSRLGRVWLGHLSRSNNTPERALEVAAEGARGRIRVDVLPHGAVAALDVHPTHPAQLGLPFAS